MSSSTSETAIRRYKEAYVVATGIIGFGTGVKSIGLVTGLGVTILGFLSTRSLGIVVAVTCAVVGALGGTLIYIIGVLIAALGQMQYATLDVAVNTSPILEADAKARLLGGSYGDFYLSSAEQPLDSLSVALPQAIAGLDSADPVIRERSASQLGDFGAVAADALAKLELLKRDPVGRVRTRAVWAIEEITRKQRLTVRPKT